VIGGDLVDGLVPTTSWLRTTDTDVQSVNIRIYSAWSDRMLNTASWGANVINAEKIKHKFPVVSPPEIFPFETNIKYKKVQDNILIFTGIYICVYVCPAQYCILDVNCI